MKEDNKCDLSSNCRAKSKEMSNIVPSLFMPDWHSWGRSCNGLLIIQIQFEPLSL